MTDKGYYTNSFHPTWRSRSIGTTSWTSGAYSPIASGGFICYGEHPNIQHNLEALENVWDYSYGKGPTGHNPHRRVLRLRLHRRVGVHLQGLHLPRRQPRPRPGSVTRRVCGYLGQPRMRAPSMRASQEEVKCRVKHLGNGQIG
ncbi:anaerobic ribonucleoside-triphosphate reductase [Shigella flexneri]